MKFTPVKEEEMESNFKPLAPGYYNFEVKDAEETVSKSGNEMIKLTLKVWDNKGKEYTLYDYLLSSANMMWKLKHFCDSCELAEIYENGELTDSACIGKCGKVETDIEKQEGYGPRAKVKDYVIDGLRGGCISTGE